MSVGGGGRPRLPLLRALVGSISLLTLIHCSACRKGGGGGGGGGTIFVQVHGWSFTSTRTTRRHVLGRFPPQRRPPTTSSTTIFDGLTSLALEKERLSTLSDNNSRRQRRRIIFVASAKALTSPTGDDDGSSSPTTRAMQEGDDGIAARQDERGANGPVNTSPNQLRDLPSSKLKCRYFALRHGQSEANVQGLIASNPEVACSKYGLSPLGLQQAIKAGHDVVEYYRKHLLSSDAEEDGGAASSARIVILTSDLLRAKQTAETVRDAVLAAPHGLASLYTGDVIVETRLRERGFGNWDLASDDNYKRVWEDDANNSSHTINSVESVDSVMRRVTSAIVEWDSKLCGEEDGATDVASSVAAYPRTMVICVAHGDVLQILQTAFEKMDGTLHRTLPHLETATLRPLVLKED